VSDVSIDGQSCTLIGFNIIAEHTRKSRAIDFVASLANGIPPTTSSPSVPTPASYETALHAPVMLSDTLSQMQGLLSFNNTPSQMQGLPSFDGTLPSASDVFDSSYSTFNDLSTSLTFGTDVTMPLDPYDTSITSTPASNFDFNLPDHSLSSGATTPASAMGDLLPGLSLSSSLMPDTPITSWRKEMYVPPAFATPPRLCFHATPTVATLSPSCAPFLTSNEVEYNFGSSTCLPNTREALVLAPPVVSSASASDVGNLDSSLAPSPIEVTQVSEQPALVSSAGVGLADGHCVVGVNDAVVPAVRKMKRMRQQTTRLAQADNIGNSNVHKRFVIFGSTQCLQALTQSLGRKRLCDTIPCFVFCQFRVPFVIPSLSSDIYMSCVVEFERISG